MARSPENPGLGRFVGDVRYFVVLLLYYYCVVTLSIPFKKSFQKLFFPQIQVYQGFQGFSIFCRKKFFRIFFIFFLGFCIGSEEGTEKSRRIGKTKRTCRKNTTAHSRPGEIYRTAPEEKKGPKRRDKENRQPDTAEGRRKKGQGKYHMSGGMRQLSMSKGKLGRNCQPFAICRFTLQRESSGSVKGKSFAYILSTAFI